MLAVFVVVPAAVVYTLRLIVLVYKRVSGKHEIEKAEREAERQEYLNPDWDSYKIFLEREPPESMKLLFECPSIADNPVVRVSDEEYYLYPVRHRKYTEPDF